MDEYYCKAYPLDSRSASESRVWPNDQQHFSVDFQYSDMQVLNGSKLEEAFDNVLLHNFQNIPKNDMLKETTIVSCLSDVGVPRNAHGVVVAEVLRCARDMIGDTAHTDTRLLRMRVEIAIARAKQDEISVSGNQDGITVTEINSVSDDDYFEEALEYGFDEDDDDYGLMPADKAFVEGLEDVQQKGSQRCAICFEDFLFGVRMPCLHAFHKSCISEWLRIGNSCPLCRFYLPTQTD
ncbi:hypothetical protein V8G54_025409 [Vigna mungo]|uniref:RING-type E3 ubiquitin transferase n=1 Tax=Vigna mungo TaxID=3915 RepID=A0AAQ3MWW3_VIGMU